MPSTPASAPRETPFPVRWVQLARAGAAAIAAVMITFSPDHSASVGLTVFSGFAITTGLVLGLAAWLTYPAGKRWGAVCLSIVAILSGITAGVSLWHGVVFFFVVVSVWAILSGFFEILWGARERRRARAAGEDAAEARDGLTIGVLTLVLGLVLPFIPMQYALDYYIDDARQWFTLTGITIAVGVFGGYAAIVAVFLGIAGLSPKRVRPVADSAPDAQDATVVDAPPPPSPTEGTR